MNGVSVIVCCYNSEDRLRETLKHLASQKVTPEINWEIIIVDNASTDNTVGFAKDEWLRYDCNVDFNIVLEPKPGLKNAREKGITESRYEFLVFCDDDNWLSENYVQSIYQVFKENNNVGIVGALIVPLLGCEKPDWFDDFAGGYAVGRQAEVSGDVTDTRGWVYGAGMGLRKSAHVQLRKQSFQSLLSDRKGTNLSSGNDSELCLALQLIGYRIYVTNEISLTHYITASRLTKEYAISLYKGFGKSFVKLAAYNYVLQNKKAANSFSVIRLLFNQFSIISLKSIAFSLFSSSYRKKYFERPYMIMTVSAIKEYIIEFFRFRAYTRRVLNIIR